MAENERIFVYPQKKVYPFDDVCEQIVRESEKRDFLIPGVKFIRNLYQCNKHESEYNYCSEIWSDDYKLIFKRVQGRILPGWNQTLGGLSKLVTKNKIFSFGDNFQNISVRYFYGNNLDYMHYIDVCKDHECLYEQMEHFVFKPFTFFKSINGCSFCSESQTHFNTPPLLLEFDEDIGQIITDENGSNVTIKTDDILNEVKYFLENIVLSKILSTPISEK